MQTSVDQHERIQPAFHKKIKHDRDQGRIEPAKLNKVYCRSCPCYQPMDHKRQRVRKTDCTKKRERQEGSRACTALIQKIGKSCPKNEREAAMSRLPNDSCNAQNHQDWDKCIACK